MRSTLLLRYTVLAAALGCGALYAYATDTSRAPVESSEAAVDSETRDSTPPIRALHGASQNDSTGTPRGDGRTGSPAETLAPKSSPEAHSIVAPDDLHLEEEHTPRSKLDLYYGISTFTYLRDEHGPLSSRWKHILDLRAAKRWAEALEFLRLDVDEAPQDVLRRLDYIQLLLQVGNISEATTVIAAGLERAPGHPLLRITEDGVQRLQLARTPNQRRSALLGLETHLFEARQLYMKIARKPRI